MSDKYPVIGTDTSSWEGPLDMDKMSRAAQFVLPRASIAISEDREFKNTWTNGRGKIKRGAFHFLSVLASIRGQAQLFADLLKSDPGEIEPYVDFEEEEQQVGKRRRDKKHLNFSQLDGFITYFEEDIMRIFGRWPWKYRTGIYTGYSYWRDYGTKLDKYRERPLWISCPDPVDEPFPLAPWSIDWTFWQTQFAADGPTYGTNRLYAKGIDLNCYHGTLEQFKKDYGGFVQLPLPIPPTPLPTSPLPEYAPGFPKTGRIVASPNLRVRSGPGTMFPVVSAYLPGQHVVFSEVQNVNDGEWGRVASNTEWWCAITYKGVQLVEWL